MKIREVEKTLLSKALYLYYIIFIFCIGPVYSQGKIGIALPMMEKSDNPDDKKLGNQILMGIKDALEEYNNDNPSKKISIEVKDTKREQSETLQIFNEFGSDKNIIAILGPVFSSELMNNEGAAVFHKIPIITPTATENFLAEKNPYLFQLNPTYDIRGRLMAEFADSVLKMKNFAIFSEDTYGVNFSQAFSDEVSKNGGQIIFTQYYKKDNFDLTKDLEELKTKIFERDRFIDFGTLSDEEIKKLRKIDLKYSYTDSLVRKKLVVSVYKLFGRNALRISDSIGISPVKVTNASDSKKYILGFVEAVYMPVSNSEEITKVVPQYFANNIDIPILGTSDWNNENILQKNKVYIDQLYFDADFHINDKNKGDFESQDESEIRNYYFGYDPMKLILDKISEGNNTRQSLNDALEKVNDYKAVHCNYTIKERTNHQMSIMNFRNGRIEKISDFVY